MLCCLSPSYHQHIPHTHPASALQVQPFYFAFYRKRATALMCCFSKPCPRACVSASPPLPRQTSLKSHHSFLIFTGTCQSPKASSEPYHICIVELLTSFPGHLRLGESVLEAVQAASADSRTLLAVLTSLWLGFISFFF